MCVAGGKRCQGSTGSKAGRAAATRVASALTFGHLDQDQLDAVFDAAKDRAAADAPQPSPDQVADHFDGVRSRLRHAPSFTSRPDADRAETERLLDRAASHVPDGRTFAAMRTVNADAEVARIALTGVTSCDPDRNPYNTGQYGADNPFDGTRPGKDALDSYRAQAKADTTLAAPEGAGVPRGVPGDRATRYALHRMRADATAHTTAVAAANETVRAGDFAVRLHTAKVRNAGTVTAPAVGDTVTVTDHQAETTSRVDHTGRVVEVAPVPGRAPNEGPDVVVRTPDGRTARVPAWQVAAENPDAGYRPDPTADMTDRDLRVAAGVDPDAYDDAARVLAATRG